MFQPLNTRGKTELGQCRFVNPRELMELDNDVACGYHSGPHNSRLKEI